MLVQKHALATRMGTDGQIVLNLTQQFENLVYSTIQNRFKKCSKIYIYILGQKVSRGINLEEFVLVISY